MSTYVCQNWNNSLQQSFAFSVACHQLEYLLLPPAAPVTWPSHDCHMTYLPAFSRVLRRSSWKIWEQISSFRVTTTPLSTSGSARALLSKSSRARTRLYSCNQREIFLLEAHLPIIFIVNKGQASSIRSPPSYSGTPKWQKNTKFSLIVGSIRSTPSQWWVGLVVSWQWTPSLRLLLPPPHHQREGHQSSCVGLTENSETAYPTSAQTSPVCTLHHG